MSWDPGRYSSKWRHRRATVTVSQMVMDGCSAASDASLIAVVADGSASLIAPIWFAVIASMAWAAVTPVWRNGSAELAEAIARSHTHDRLITTDARIR